MKKTLAILSAVIKAWRRYRLSLAVAGILIVSVVFYGLHDRGMILAYVATAIIMAEITYRWRKIRYFLFLALAAFLSAIFVSFLHEVVVLPLVRILLGPGALNSTGVRVFHDAVSLWVLFPGLMGIVFGVVGTIVLGIARLVGLITRDRTAHGT
jgi:hypothetical protein